MNKSFGFLPRATFRDLARGAYRSVMFTGRHQSVVKVDMIKYTISMDFKLGCVFFDWTSPEGEAKSTSVKIAKSWL